MNDTRMVALIDDLRAMSGEASWFEFKHNNADPKMIGIRISALANAARLAGQDFAYIIWGIRDFDHAVVGTTFEPEAKSNGQPLEFDLANRLQPGLALRFKRVPHPDGAIVLLEIPAATLPACRASLR